MRKYLYQSCLIPIFTKNINNLYPNLMGTDPNQKLTLPKPIYDVPGSSIPINILNAKLEDKKT